VPQLILDKIEAAVRDVFQQPDVKTALLDRGLMATGTSSAEFRDIYDRESKVILGRMRDLNIQEQ